MNASARVTIGDLSLRDCALTQRVASLRNAYFEAMPEICVERARLLTRYHLENGLFEKDRITILDKAKAYRYVLENRTPVVWHTHAYRKSDRWFCRGVERFEFIGESLLAGSTTSKFKGVPLYPEFLALTLWPELHTMTDRAQNPYYITDAEIEELNYDVFPYWMNRTILELAKARYQWNGPPGDEDRIPDFQLLQHLVFFLTSKPNCISHTIPDFSRVLKEGLRAIIEEVQEKASDASDASQRMFYHAVAEAMEGIAAYARRLANRADELARRETNRHRRDQLLKLARIHRNVPERPARTFREGITAVWLCWVALHLENPNVGLSLGRLDQLLHDLYRADISAGRLDEKRAVELICCLWLKIGDHVPTIPETGEQLFGGTGSNQAITIGGVDRRGHDAVNDLTYVMLRATELMMLRDPNLNARYMLGVNSDEYLERLCLANIKTRATPALHNDKAVIEALKSRGDTEGDARDYGVVGCVEPCSAGRHYGHSGALLLNLASALELTLYNGRHRHTGVGNEDPLISIETGDPADFRDSEEFKSAFFRQVAWLADAAVVINNCLGHIHQDYYPTPIMSALFEGPMDSGKDVIQGGAVGNSSGVAIIGLADVADCLTAIEEHVFGGDAVTFDTLLDALEHDFEGQREFRELHALLTNPAKTPKYGNDNRTADKNVHRIAEELNRIFGAKENYRGGKYRVGYWTMTNHAGFGRLTKALPNGRRARENFASGITPVSGVTPDLTKALHSVASIPNSHVTNGMALNIRFPGVPDDEDVQNREAGILAGRVKAYFEGGGMEIQFNIAPHEDFVEVARHPERHPERFRELLVRVSGYTAYFKDLNPQMQQEIINRTEYSLSDGAAIDHRQFLLPDGRR